MVIRDSQNPIVALNSHRKNGAVNTYRPHSAISLTRNMLNINIIFMWMTFVMHQTTVHLFVSNSEFKRKYISIFDWNNFSVICSISCDYYYIIVCMYIVHSFVEKIHQNHLHTCAPTFIIHHRSTDDIVSSSMCWRNKTKNDDDNTQ